MKRTALKRRPRQKKPRENQAHRDWICEQPCLVRDETCTGDIVPAHVRNGIPFEHSDKRGGMALKPEDSLIVPLCWWHHGVQTHIGERAFWARYPIDPVETALELARKSPHLRRQR